MQDAQVVGLSVLPTTMVPEIQTVVDELVESGLRSQVQVVIGEGCTTPELAREMGCDVHGADAVAAVYIIEELMARWEEGG